MKTRGPTRVLAALLLAVLGHAEAQDGAPEAQAPEGQALDPQVEAARAAAERVRLAKETITVDRGLLGVVLLEPLTLPVCDRELELPADLMGIGHGAKQTCRIAAPAVLPRQLEAAFKATVSLAQAQRSWVPVVLEDALCPPWMRNGGTCMFLVALVDEVAAGALVATGLDAKAIETHLAKKYQTPAKDGDEVQCGNRRTRAITSHTTERVWALPGLAVSFEPVSRDCTHGRVLIETTLMRPAVAAPSALYLFYGRDDLPKVVDVARADAVLRGAGFALPLPEFNAGASGDLDGDGLADLVIGGVDGAHFVFAASNGWRATTTSPT